MELSKQLITNIGLVLILLCILASVLIIAVREYAAQDTPKYQVGVVDSSLTACDGYHNCFDTKGENAPELKQKSTTEETKTAIKSAMETVPRTQLINENEEYLHYTVSSKVFGFIDDAEFYFPSNEDSVYYRSSARTGYGDLGVNKKRMVAFSQRYQSIE